MGCLLEIRGGEEEGGGVNARKMLVWEDVVWVNKWADPFKSVTIHSDGRHYTVPAGTQIKLCPGESITVYPYMYHDFEVEFGTGSVLLGEVSMCNDDTNDNRFYEPMGRFPVIEEDELPYRLLCNEYPKARNK